MTSGPMLSSGQQEGQPCLRGEQLSLHASRSPSLNPKLSPFFKNSKTTRRDSEPVGERRTQGEREMP